MATLPESKSRYEKRMIRPDGINCLTDRGQYRNRNTIGEIIANDSQSNGLRIVGTSLTSSFVSLLP